MVALVKTRKNMTDEYNRLFTIEYISASPFLYVDGKPVQGLMMLSGDNTLIAFDIPLKLGNKLIETLFTTGKLDLSEYKVEVVDEEIISWNEPESFWD